MSFKRGSTVQTEIKTLLLPFKEQNPRHNDCQCFHAAIIHLMKSRMYLDSDTPYSGQSIKCVPVWHLSCKIMLKVWLHFNSRCQVQ